MKTLTPDLKIVPELGEKNAFLLFYKITAIKAGLKQLRQWTQVEASPVAFQMDRGYKWQKWTAKGSLGWDPAGHILNRLHLHTTQQFSRRNI